MNKIVLTIIGICIVLIAAFFLFNPPEKQEPTKNPANSALKPNDQHEKAAKGLERALTKFRASKDALAFKGAT